jgi:hypothetical protein
MVNFFNDGAGGNFFTMANQTGHFFNRFLYSTHISGKGW